MGPPSAVSNKRAGREVGQCLPYGALNSLAELFGNPFNEIPVDRLPIAAEPMGEIDFAQEDKATASHISRTCQEAANGTKDVDVNVTLRVSLVSFFVTFQELPTKLSMTTLFCSVYVVRKN